MIAKIVVATDGSAHADKAVAFAADLAEKYGAEIDLVHVMRELGAAVVPPGLRHLERIEHVEVTERDLLETLAREILESASDVARSRGAAKVEIYTRIGDPAREVVKHAEEAAADMIVMGTRGLGNLEAMLLGSVARKVGHLAPCTCATVH